MTKHMTEGPVKATTSQYTFTFLGPTAEGQVYDGLGPLSLTASWDSSLVSIQQHTPHSPRRPGLARSRLPAAWPTQHYASAAAKFVGWVWSRIFPSPPLARNQPLGKLFSCATGHHGRWDPGSMTLLIYPSLGVIICLAPEVLGFTSSNRLRRLHPHH